MRVLTIDIGGSSVKHSIAAVSDDGSSVELDLVGREELPSTSFADLKAVVQQIVGRRGADELPIGISTSGSVDREGTVISAGHFEGYVDVDWRDHLIPNPEGRLVVVNDGRAAAWGEYSTRSRRPETLVHVVLGTGVGGGIVHRNELLLGDSGQAGYIGHIRVTDAETSECSCGRTGHVESMSSERGILDTYAREAGSGGAERPASLTQILRSADRDDSALTRALTAAGWGLGAGLGAVLNILNPAVITIGGGLTNALREESASDIRAGEVFMSGVSRGMHDTSHKRPFAAVECDWGSLGNDAGLVGAALLAANLTPGKGL